MGFLLATTIGSLIVYHRRIQREYDRLQPDFRQRLALENAALDRDLSELLAQHRALIERSCTTGLKTVDEDLLEQARAEVEAFLKEDTLEEQFRKLERDHGKGKKKTGV